MENDFLAATSQAFTQYGVWMLLAILVLGAATVLWLYRNQASRQRELQKEMQALRYELDDRQMHGRRPAPNFSPNAVQHSSQHSSQHSNQHSRQSSGQSAIQSPVQSSVPLSPHPTPRPLNRMQADLELQAYQKIWASVRELHDKLGTFLRAIETGESLADSRMAARTAALKAKDCAQRLRPFYPENIETLVFQLIDNEVHMHLSACAYLDDSPELPGENGGDQTRSAYQSLRDESKLIYDGECRQQLNALVQSIRYRLSNQQVVE